MKIADVSGFYSETGGGVASYVRQKLDYAARHGHEVVVIAPGAESRVEERAGGRIVWVKSPKMPFDDNYHVFWRGAEVWAALDREAADVVEGSSPWRGGWLAGAWPGDAVKSLVFHQDFIAGYPYTLLGGMMSREQLDGLFAGYWSYVRRLSRRFDITVTGGEWLAARLAAFELKSPVAAPFGIETERFSPAKRDEELRRSLLAACGVGSEGKLLLAVGRLHPEKRHSAMIEAFDRARQSRPALGFVIIGDGPIRHSVQTRVDRTQSVRLLDPIKDRENMARHLASADVLVHGSGAETYGLAVAEAMASGLPVVSPDAGGAADLARKGRSRLYETGNARACAEAILALLEDLERDPVVKPFTAGGADAHFDTLFGLYGALLEARGRRSPTLARGSG